MHWRLRTAAMFALLTAILVVIGSLVGGIFNNWMLGLVVMLGISVLINIFSYFFSKNMALSANKVKIVTREEEPRLYGIVEELVQKAGLPMPEVGISNLPMPNAFATGRNPKNAAVVATRQRRPAATAVPRTRPAGPRPVRAPAAAPPRSCP